MNPALWYLLLHTTRNQWRVRIARLKNPRYAIALVLGVLYFWFLYFRPRSGASGANVGPTVDATLVALAPLLLVLYAAWVWIFGRDRSALAFSQAEVSMLFPAPLTRRSLIGFKLLKAQVPILISGIFWVAIMRNGRTALPHTLRYLGLYVVMTTLVLHRTGAALVTANALEHRARGVRRTVVSLVVFAAVFGTIAWACWNAYPAFDAGLKEGAKALANALQRAPASIAMYPFNVALALIFATNSAEWLRAMGPALALLALHVWWVLRTDSAFEESAVAASLVLAKRIEAMRTRQGAAAPISAKAAKRSLPLAPTGAPAVAIVWKNTLWLMRSGALRGVFLPALILLVTLVVLRGQPQVLAAMMIVAGGGISAMLVLFGPMTLRNDLRSDLLHLPMLKTMPMRGREVVLAQVASGAIPLAVAQYLTMLVAFAGAFASGGAEIAAKAPLDVAIAVALGAPLLLLGLNGVNFVIHNAIALLFPAWVKLGEHGAGGVEAMGQMMMTMIAVLLCLALSLVLPAAAGAVLFFAFKAQVAVATAVCVVGAGAALVAECYGLAALLGGAFERVEPSQVG